MSFKILFMGTPDFAVPILESIHQSNHKILEVYTQPPKKKNRGQKISFSPVHEYSNKINIPIRHPLTLESEEEFEHIKKLKPDISVIVAYGKILPSKFLNLKNTIFLNIHASLLPKWRGAAPIQRAIMNLDKEIGISIMKIVEELDSGPISNIYKIKLENNKNSQEISERLSLLAAEKILDEIDNILDDNVKFTDQEHSKATYAKKIDKVEGVINWNDKADLILGKINGLSPSPGAFFIFNGERYKILKAEISNGLGKAGEVLNDKLEIACSYNKSIKILEIQRQGKNSQKTREFMLGSQIKKGAIISNV